MESFPIKQNHSYMTIYVDIDNFTNSDIAKWKSNLILEMFSSLTEKCNSHYLFLRKILLAQYFTMHA